MAINPVGKSGVSLALLLFCGSVLAQPAQTVSYEIDSAESQVYWLVYSAGALSRLGHNHAISTPALTGMVEVAPQISLSSFSVEIPVATLVVDDPVLRAQLGGEFSGNPSADDIAGTRRNMLSERLLNADQHPILRISGTGPQGETGVQTLALSVEIAGTTAEVIVPANVSIEGSTVTAEGTFRLTHEALGLRPFSALMGTLKVAEEMDFHYRIVARRVN